LKDLAGSAAGKGIDAIKGGDDHAPKSDGHADAAQSSAAPHKEESLMEKGQHAVDEFAHHQIDKAGDYLQQVAHNPQVLFNQLADMVKDHYGQDTANALAKLLGVHPNADTQAHAPVETSHAEHSAASALVQAIHAEEHGTATQALTQDTAASAVENAHIPVLEAHPLVPSHGDPQSEVASHASLAALSGHEANALGGHDMQAALQNALHGISFSALGGLDGAHAGQSHGAEAGIIVIGGHEMALDSLMHATQQAPVYDHDMPAHFEMPSLLELHAAHSAHQLV
jgi:hypothetical protein